MKKFITASLITALATTQLSPLKANAQGALIIPEAATVVIIGGIAYYVWLNSQGQEQMSPVNSGDYLEDPEDSDQWGEYPAVRTYQGCRWQAAGRDWEWNDLTKKCRIKG